MRTIKFRFWQPSTRTMQKWEDYQQYGIFEMFNNVDSIPLQFTGLTDKNGVDIYVGDICKTRYGTTFSYGDLVSYHLWDINNSNAFSEIEVIGNIYQDDKKADQ